VEAANDQRDRHEADDAQAPARGAAHDRGNERGRGADDNQLGAKVTYGRTPHGSLLVAE
jgi:hypothetical protein